MVLTASPSAIDLVTNISDYSYDRRRQIFLQQQASRQLLDRLVKGNPHLSKAVSSSLVQKAEVALAERSDDAADTLEDILKALGNNRRVPVMFAIDEFQALFNTSLYRDPYFKPIEACHLSLPRLLLEFASGRQEHVSGIRFARFGYEC